MADKDEKAAEKAAADKHAAEKRELQKKEQTAALSGAESVADAVRRVADAAVAEVQKSNLGVLPDVIVSGTPGGSFELRAGPNISFGASGTVTFGKQQAVTTEWSTSRIVGTVPANVGDNEVTDVTVHVDDKTKHVGQFKR
jgi:hypothetical protein